MVVTVPMLQVMGSGGIMQPQLSLGIEPDLQVMYRLDTSALVEQGPKSHFSTLEQLLAWQKKLYQEVKSREGENNEHEKKLSEYRGVGETNWTRQRNP
ncbi:hypothetical protein MKX03_023351 [Papaver bracteatum]|nr:hypothetical protein MKX03_023351 [Papaver bracteatum]